MRLARPYRGLGRHAMSVSLRPRRLVAIAVLSCPVFVAAGATAARARRQTPAQRMQEAARALLDAATGHLADLQTGSDNPERRNWGYAPVPRRGLPLFAVSDAIRQRIWDLVDTGLGERGRRQAREVIALEERLFRRSGDDDRLDPGRYFVTLFGVPGRLGDWGWRFEGHHLSLNFRIRDGRVVGSTPAFFGGEPARSGEPDAPEPFAAEEADARALVTSLPESLRRAAVISSSAPKDVLTGNDVPAARPPLLGVSHEQLDDDARERLVGLLQLYASRFAPELAAAELSAIDAAGLARVHIAWAGGLEPGEPCYYRIQGPTFVVEYSVTGDDAGHVHTVWRDFASDFGGDPTR